MSIVFAEKSQANFKSAGGGERMKSETLILHSDLNYYYASVSYALFRER